MLASVSTYGVAKGVIATSGGQHVGDGGAERDATGMMSILGIVGSLAFFSFMGRGSNRRLKRQVGNASG